MIDRVALFVTCLADTLFPDVGKATVTVLERLGIEVVFPLEQTCCGQMHANSGYPGEAELLARRFVEIFDALRRRGDSVRLLRGTGAEHMPGLLGGDDRGVPARTWELSQFLTGVLGVEDVGSGYRGHARLSPDVSLAAASPSRRRAVAAARRGRRRRARSTFRDAEECCGFGGTFAVKNADVSSRDARREAGRDRRLGSGDVCACDSSCLMHIGGGLRRRGSTCGPCTSPRSWRRERRAARDARPEAFPHEAPPRSRTLGCARTSGTPRARSAEARRRRR